jgi:hypothetical protein
VGVFFLVFWPEKKSIAFCPAPTDKSAAPALLLFLGLIEKASQLASLPQTKALLLRIGTMMA